MALTCSLIAFALFWILWREASFMLSLRCPLRLRIHALLQPQATVWLILWVIKADTLPFLIF